jgi:CheY-like chemotaxis protein
MMQQPAALKGLRVLVVDDQKFIRGMVAQGLKAAGAEIVEASDGFAGLNVIGMGADVASSFDRLREKRPDLFETGASAQRTIDCVVTDIRMAPMNGLEMLKSIRIGYTKAKRDLPIIIMSAHTDEPLIGAAIALDAHGFVSKPVSQKTVVDRIVRAMKVKMNPKPVEVYKTLIIPELDEAILQTDVSQLTNEFMATIRAGDVNALTGERSITVKWETLTVGDVVAADFKTKGGQLVVPAGTQVTDVLMSAMQGLCQVAPLCDEIQIRRKVM